MNEDVRDLAPEEKESTKIQRQFTQVCAQIGDALHKIEMFKSEQKTLQEAYAKAMAEEKAKDAPIPD